MLGGEGTRKAGAIATAEYLEFAFIPPDGHRETVVREVFSQAIGHGMDSDEPALMPHVMTTRAPTPDRVMGPTISPDLTQSALARHHGLDRGYVDAELRVTAPTPHPSAGVGPSWGGLVVHAGKTSACHCDIRL